MLKNTVCILTITLWLAYAFTAYFFISSDAYNESAAAVLNYADDIVDKSPYPDSPEGHSTENIIFIEHIKTVIKIVVFTLLFSISCILILLNKNTGAYALLLVSAIYLVIHIYQSYLAVPSYIIEIVKLEFLIWKKAGYSFLGLLESYLLPLWSILTLVMAFKFINNPIRSLKKT